MQDAPLSTVDYTFFYKNVVRFILCQKALGIKNSYNIPYISKLVCYFSVAKIDDWTSAEYYNYVYLFKFFFGKRAFFTKFRTYFDCGVYSYSFNIMIIINKLQYDSIYYLLNDVMCGADDSYISKQIFNKNLNIFYIAYHDINKFSEKKDNLGLFKVKRKLNIKLFCEGLDLTSAKLLLRNLKIDLF